MRRVPHWIHDLSFAKKIIFLLFLAGVLPLALVTILSVDALQRSTEEKQLYQINNQYEQALLSLTDKLDRVHNISTLISVNDTISTTLTPDSADPGKVLEQLADFESISSYTQSIELSHEGSGVLYYISDTFIVAQNHSGRFRPLSSADAFAWADKVRQNHGRPTWVLFDAKTPQSAKTLALARYLWDHADYERPLGILLIHVDGDAVYSMLKGMIPGQTTALITEDGEVLASHGGYADWHELKGWLRADRAFHVIELNKVRYLARVSPISRTGLYLVSLLPSGLITQEVRNTLWGVLLLYTLIIAAMLLLITPMIRSIVKRITMLGRQIQLTESKGLRKLDIAPHQDEIGQLITSYNAMVDEMQKMLAAQYELGKAKSNAELKALQSQINPHFLYNTLDMVSWMAQRNESANIQHVMQALSRFYRYTLNRGEDIITLAEEVELCRAYMDIQRMRWSGIDFRIDVETSLHDVLLPKITLQPLIENAVQHGIRPRGNLSGRIVISAIRGDESAEGTMTLSVVDDGIGMDNSEKEKHKGHGSHYGLLNIEKRLSLFFEKDIPLLVESYEGLGTCVSMILPIVRSGVIEEGV
jgi:two-component system sensor histidine kinase YesM